MPFQMDYGWLEQGITELSNIPRSYYGRLSGITKKSDRDIVTEADYECERAIIKRLERYYPGYNILAEESSYKDKGSNYTWVIDPLDGTIFFSRGIPFWSVSIGLMYKDEIIVGAVSNPMLDEVFFAEKGSGAYCNGKKINVSFESELSAAATLIDYATDLTSVNKAISAMKVIANNSRFVRSFACEVFELMAEASGKFDANLCYGARLWDIAAAKVILEEAGGMLTNIDGSQINPYKERFDVLATNGILHELFINLIKTD